MQNLIDYTLKHELNSATQTQKVHILFKYMEKRGQSFYDEAVTQLEHALQCGALAKQNDASPELITSALLHDIGHFILDEHNAEDNFLDLDLNHEEIGAHYLETFFPDIVTTPIRLHVPAKRYLCTSDPTYYEGLSNASKKSLIVQGGTMSEKECTSFEQIPHYRNALTLRRWDDMAKIKGIETPDLHTYHEIVQGCLL